MNRNISILLVTNWTDAGERGRVCLIFAGKALRDDKMCMSRIGIKEGDTMHAFYKNPPESTTNSNSGGSTSPSQNPTAEDDDDFDELARYFLPLAGSLLSMQFHILFCLL